MRRGVGPPKTKPQADYLVQLDLRRPLFQRPEPVLQASFPCDSYFHGHWDVSYTMVSRAVLH